MNQYQKDFVIRTILMALGLLFISQKQKEGLSFEYQPQTSYLMTDQHQTMYSLPLEFKMEGLTSGTGAGNLPAKESAKKTKNVPHPAPANVQPNPPSNSTKTSNPQEGPGQMSIEGDQQTLKSEIDKVTTQINQLKVTSIDELSRENNNILAGFSDYARGRILEGGQRLALRFQKASRHVNINLQINSLQVESEVTTAARARTGSDESELRTRRINEILGLKGPKAEEMSNICDEYHEKEKTANGPVEKRKRIALRIHDQEKRILELEEAVRKGELPPAESSTDRKHPLVKAKRVAAELSNAFEVCHQKCTIVLEDSSNAGKLMSNSITEHILENRDVLDKEALQVEAHNSVGLDVSGSTPLRFAIAGEETCVSQQAANRMLHVLKRGGRKKANHFSDREGNICIAMGVINRFPGGFADQVAHKYVKDFPEESKLAVEYINDFRKNALDEKRGETKASEAFREKWRHKAALFSSKSKDGLHHVVSIFLSTSKDFRNAPFSGQSVKIEMEAEAFKITKQVAGKCKQALAFKDPADQAIFTRYLTPYFDKKAEAVQSERHHVVHKKSGGANTAANCIVFTGIEHACVHGAKNIDREYRLGKPAEAHSDGAATIGMNRFRKRMNPATVVNAPGAEAFALFVSFETLRKSKITLLFSIKDTYRLIEREKHEAEMEELRSPDFDLETYLSKRKKDREEGQELEKLMAEIEREEQRQRREELKELSEFVARLKASF